MLTARKIFYIKLLFLECNDLYATVIDFWQYTIGSSYVTKTFSWAVANLMLDREIALRLGWHVLLREKYNVIQDVMLKECRV